MHTLNVHQDFKPYHVEDISINSPEGLELLNAVNSTNIDSTLDIRESWKLVKAYSIKNKSFEQDFIDKRDEIREVCYYPDHWDIRYGFLTTIKEKMIHRIAEEGLEIKMCPYNYLGHNISGIHISMNADVCLNEAKGKLSPGSEVTLIIFKYILGKRKMVAMHDPKILLAPTPNFDSHVCEERPVPSENNVTQYIKSLVYLYEFSSENLDAVIRPRQCCPIGALIFRTNVPFEVLDLTDSDGIEMSSFGKSSILTSHSKNSLWNTQFSVANDEKSKMNFITKEDWRPINYEDQYIRPARDSMLLRPMESDIFPNRINSWKDKRTERGQKWKEGLSIYGGANFNNSLSNRIGKS